MIGAFIVNDMIDIDFAYMDQKCKKELLNIAFNKGLVDDVKVCKKIFEVFFTNIYFNYFYECRLIYFVYILHAFIIV